MSALTDDIQGVIEHLELSTDKSYAGWATNGHWVAAQQLSRVSTAIRLSNLSAALAFVGRLEAIRKVLDYTCTDLPTQGCLTDGTWVDEAYQRIWRANMYAWKFAAGIR